MSTNNHRPDVVELLEQHAPDAMSLNQRHLNPQLGRVLRTLGFDRDWAHGRGPWLIDREGHKYLDLLSGYGVFALGRNHPYVKRQLQRVLEADTPSLPQLGLSTLAGVLAEELIGRTPTGAATGRCSRLDRRAGPGQGRVSRSRRLSPRCARALPRGGGPSDRRRGADWPRPYRALPGTRALGNRARSGRALEGSVG